MSDITSGKWSASDIGYLSRAGIIKTLWMRGDLEFLLWKQQRPIWDQLQNLPVSTELFVCLCARQYGKSTIGVIYALSEAIKNRDCCILIMGPDTKQTRDIVNSKMRFLLRTAPQGLIRQMKSENRWHVYHDLDPKALDYTEIIIGGMNENSSSQRGKTVHKILVEEIVDVKEDDFLTSMQSDLGPALTHSKDGKIIYLTTLPKYPSHPFITQVIPKARMKDAIAVFDIHSNVALTAEQFQKCMDLAGGADSDDWKREYLCQIIRDRKLVCLPDFDPRCVTPYTLPFDRIMHTTIDWGGVRDKTCAMLHTYDYNHAMDLFWDERVFEPNTPTSVIIKSVREMEAGYEIAERFIDGPHQLVSVDLHQDHQFYARLPQKSDWEATLNTLNGRFKQGKVMIHPRCKFLAISAESGILNKQRTDFERTEALGHMDGVAAMMYAVRMRDTRCPYGDLPTSGVMGDSYINLSHNVSPYKAQGTIKVVDAGVQPVKRFGRFAK
jgi:Terminase large subunit, T4likevirus-type, N-terminal